MKRIIKTILLCAISIPLTAGAYVVGMVLFASQAVPAADPAPKPPRVRLKSFDSGHAYIIAEGKASERSGQAIWFPPRASCEFKPLPDITTHELARITPHLIRGEFDVEQWATLGTASRHFVLTELPRPKLTPIDPTTHPEGPR
jgi:hypothetical protein